MNVNNLKIAFHAKLMHLFALTSKDKNSFAASKLQAKVPVQQILKSLINEAENHDNFQVDQEVRASLLHFLCYVYIDTPLLEQKLGTSVDMWKALVSVSKEMAMIFLEPDNAALVLNEEIFSKTSDKQHFFDFGAKLVAAFFKNVFKEENMNSTLDGYFDVIVVELRKLDINIVSLRCTAETLDSLRSALKNSVGEVALEEIGRKNSLAR